jgi:hypothetical protein
VRWLILVDTTYGRWCVAWVQRWVLARMLWWAGLQHDKGTGTLHTYPWSSVLKMGKYHMSRSVRHRLIILDQRVPHHHMSGWKFLKDDLGIEIWQRRALLDLVVWYCSSISCMSFCTSISWNWMCTWLQCVKICRGSNKITDSVIAVFFRLRILQMTSKSTGQPFTAHHQGSVMGRWLAISGSMRLVVQHLQCPFNRKP